MKLAAFFIFVAFACCFVDCSILTKREAEEQQCGQKGGSADNGDHQDRSFEGGFRFRRFNLGAQVGYGIENAGNTRGYDSAFVFGGRNIASCDGRTGRARIGGYRRVSCRDELIADQSSTLNAPSYIGEAQSSAILLYGLIDVGRIISVEAGVVLCRCHSIGTALIAGCLRFESAMIERKCAGGDSVIVLDRRFQLSKDIFEVLTCGCDSDNLGMCVLFLVALLFFDNIAHRIQESVILEVVFIQVGGILIRKKRIGLDGKLLAVQILVGDIVRNVRCRARSHRHGYCDDKNEHQ